MIKLKNVKTIAGQIIDAELSGEDYLIDAEGKLTMMPALIDPQVCFDDWRKGAKAAVAGGVTTVFDTPTDEPACETKEQLLTKIQLIDNQLAETPFPLRYQLYMRADENYVEEIGKAKKLMIALAIPNVKIDDKTLNLIFQTAAQENLIVALEAENSPAALKKGIELTEKYAGQLLALHVSAKNLHTIRDAKARELLVYAEVSPLQLFLGAQEDCKILWEAIQDNSIDLIGSNQLSISGIQTLLPLLLNAYSENKISLEQIVTLTRTNSETIFNLQPNEDVVLVDLDKSQAVPSEELDNPFAGKMLRGWPIYTILKGQVFTAGMSQKIKTL